MQRKFKETVLALTMSAAFKGKTYCIRTPRHLLRRRRSTNVRQTEAAETSKICSVRCDKNTYIAVSLLLQVDEKDFYVYRSKRRREMQCMIIINRIKQSEEQQWP